ncbi:MAG: FGGY-family carbohydrate kinase [Treponema sp.]|jgi:sugar (pentulose or hexulose) kinase|nr:FGGY-family carbohydrate kinase [Treponema sp.]
MMTMAIKQAIIEGKTSIGIELGSTRIKAVLIDTSKAQHAPIASGAYDWENRLENNVWTYHLDDVWKGIQSSFQALASDTQHCYGTPLVNTGAIGISAMMHGYLVFDKVDAPLTPFRTWRNTMTEQAARALTKTFRFNVPQRWSIAHLYQAMLNHETHIPNIAFITTLAGYVHWRLTGQKSLGIGDASGMFPIDSAINDYHQGMLQQFDELAHDFSWKLKDILPTVLCAGERAGALTPEGANLLDPSGSLQAGIPFCPPEGDAGTGMVATNSVKERTGNVSAGTSIFAMLVLEKPLTKVWTEIDMVTTPAGKPVAMVHCNNCTSDLDAWVKLFSELNVLTGANIEKPALYDALYYKALEGDADCGGLVSYNYYGGEPITEMEQGRPLFVRLPDSHFTLANFMRATLFSTMATLKLGMDILTEQEQVRLDNLLGHGGLFKTKDVGQRLLAAALHVPVTVMESAGEGGAWGIALLAAYMLEKDADEPLESYLTEKVFADNVGSCLEPDPKDETGFSAFIERYKAGLGIERSAVASLR